MPQTWEKLSERLNHGYKTAPFIKYPHGQAQYVLTAVKMISDTMDVQMPPAGAPRDEAQERLLAKVIERLSGIINSGPAVYRPGAAALPGAPRQKHGHRAVGEHCLEGRHRTRHRAEPCVALWQSPDILHICLDIARLC